MKKIIILPFIAIFSFIIFFACNNGGGSKAKSLVILHLNDSHDQIMPFGFEHKIGGIKRVSRLIKDEIQSSGRENCLVLHAGDFMEGTLFHNVALGALDLKLLDAMGFDFVALGNHEFCLGANHLYDILSAVKPSFTILCSNIDFSGMDAEHNLSSIVFQGYKIVEKAKRKIAIFSIITPTKIVYDESKLMEQEGVKIPSYEATVSKVQEIIASIKSNEKPDLIVLLSHLGEAEYDCPGIFDLVEKVNGIDLVVDGHSHHYYKEPIKKNNTYIVQAGSDTRFLGKMRIEFNDNSFVIADYTLLSIDDRYQDDNSLDSIIQPYYDQLKAKYGDVYNDQIATSTFTLLHSRGQGGSETYVGNLVTHAMIQATGADFSVESDGRIRSSLYEGILTTADLHRVLSLSYRPARDKGATIVIANIPGNKIKLACEFLVHGDFGYFQATNLEFVYDPSMPPFSRVKTNSIKIKGEPIDEGRTYVVATGEEVGSYFNLIGAVPVDTGMDKWVVFKNYIANLGILNSSNIGTPGRIRTAQADISIDTPDIVLSSKQGHSGEIVHIQATLRNLGDSPCSGGWVNFYYEATPLESDEGFGDDPNYLPINQEPIALPQMREFPDTATVSADWNTSNLQAGTYFIYIKAELDPACNEKILENNQTYPFQVVYKIIE